MMINIMNKWEKYYEIQEITSKIKKIKDEDKSFDIRMNPLGARSKAKMNNQRKQKTL